ncbi:uncharacterized protein LOC125374684 [Haliotis rufescens]|uniref:uncharacterized protein LOC125374684 n=1 Tax=Haliotis rufescens TaxID=6454 RepID=UPI00201F7682|nr:uncharacterized protein LOC125374684 [Haliotis rufescens]
MLRLSDLYPFIKQTRSCYFSFSFDMGDFIHWDDSDLDLDLLLGDYTDYDIEQPSDECFDGDNYTDSPVYDEASSTTGPKQAKDHEKENKKARYACPLCRKTYMSIGGFRGHVTKKHNRSDIKAHEHRQDSPGGSSPPGSTCTGNPPVPMSTIADMQDALKAVLTKSISTVILDPMNDSSCSVNGPHLVTIAKECMDNQTVQEKLISVLTPEFQEVFYKFGHGCSLSADREQLWMKFHQMRLNDELQSDLHSILVKMTSESQRIVHIFAQCLMDRIMRNILKYISESQKKHFEQTASTISDNDQAVLFYVAGYILHAVLKKKMICGTDIDMHVEEWLASSDESSKSVYNEKFSKWTQKMSRGGLKFPSSNFYLLVRSFEIEMRTKVELSQLCASSLLCDKLKETIMTNYMVSYHWDQ